jgi:hypothetical protein
MTDEELFAIARLPAPQPPIGEGRAMGTDGFGEISFADRYGADETKAAIGILLELIDGPSDLLCTSSDELWLKWEELDRLIGEADERASNEAGGASDLYQARGALGADL